MDIPTIECPASLSQAGSQYQQTIHGKRGPNSGLSCDFLLSMLLTKIIENKNDKDNKNG
jgi:hypothetical protein